MYDSEEVNVQQQINKIFAGRLTNLPAATSRVVRIFTSSTFTDTTMERNTLMEEVYPRIKEYCRETHGLDFQVVDMRWGVRDEATDDHMTTQLCMNEIYNCQRLSMGPNFVVFLCQKYGYRPLPTITLASELDMLISSLRDMREDTTTLETWYKLDANAVPPVYVLQPISSILINFNNKRMQKLQEQDAATWWDVMGKMQRLVRKAAKHCYENGSLTQDEMHNYFMSVTEREVINGILKAKKTKDHCLCYFRHINDINLNNLRSASKFVDIAGGQIDAEAAKLLSNLRDDRVPAKLDNSNIARFGIDWAGRDGLDPVSHAKYLQDFSEHFYRSITDLVNRAMQRNAMFMSDAVYTEILQHAHNCETVCSVFFGREDELKVLQKYISEDSNEPLILYGESGSGKTSVLAKAASLVPAWLSARSPVCVVRFLGTSPDSSAICPLLISLSDQIAFNYEESRGKAPQELSQLFAYFKKMMELANDRKPLTIFLDSLDFLSKSDGAHELLWFPPTLPKNVKLVVSTNPAASNIFRTAQRIIETKENYLEVTPLSLDLSETIIKEWLKTNNRTLSVRQWETVQKALAKCTLPIFVKLVFATICRWKSYSRAQDTLLSGSVHECIQSLFERTEAQHGKLLVSHALSYITAAKNGISESELEDLISLDDKVLDDVYQYHLPPVRRIPPLLWTRIRADLPGYLSERDADGVIVLNWYHKQFKEAGIERYFKNLNHLRFTHSSMADHFLGIWGNVAKPFQYTEIQRQRFGLQEREGLADRKVPLQPNVFHGHGDCAVRYNTRKLSELPFHLLRANRLDDLYNKALFNYDFIQSKICSFPLQSLMADYEDACRHINDAQIRRELSLVADALRLSASVLSKHPFMLPVEILGRLLPLADKHPNVRSLIVQCLTEGSKQNGILPVHHCFQAPGGPLKYSMEDHNFAVFGMALTKDKKMLVSVSNRFIIWDLSTGDIARQVDPSIQGIMFGLSLSANDRFAATFTNTNEVLTMNMLTGEWKSFRDDSIPDQMAIQGIVCTHSEVAFWTKTRWFVYALDGKLRCRHEAVASKQILMVAFKASEEYHVVRWSGVSGDETIALETRKNSNDAVDGNAEDVRFYNALCLTSTYSTVYGCINENYTIGKHIWNATCWQLEPTFSLNEPQERQKPLALRLSENGTFLAAVIAEGYNVWNLDTGRLFQLKLPHGVRNIPLRPMQTTSPSCFANNEQFLAAGVRKNLYIWNIELQQLVLTLDAHFGRILHLLSLSSGGQSSVLSSSIDHSVKVWNMSNIFERVFNIERLEKCIDAIQIAAENPNIVLTVTRKYAAVWNTKTHQIIATLAASEHGAVVTHGLISANGRYAFTVESGHIFLWDISAERVLAKVDEDGIQQFFFVEKQKMIGSVTKDDYANRARLTVRSSEDLGVLYTFEYQFKRFFDIAVMKGHAFMVAVTEMKGKEFLEPIHAKSGTAVYKIKLAKIAAASTFVALPHSANQVAFVDAEKGSIWDIKSKKLLRTVLRWNGTCTSDGKYGLHAPPRGGLELLDLKTGDTVRVLLPRLAAEGVNEIRTKFTSDNRYVLYYHHGKEELSVFRTSDGKRIASFKSHAHISSFVATPETNRLLLGGIDGSLLVTSLVDPEEPESLVALAKQPSYRPLAQHFGIQQADLEADEANAPSLTLNLKTVGRAAKKFKELGGIQRSPTTADKSSVCVLQ